MAKLLLTLAHPNPESLNAATAKSMQEALEKEGHEVRMNDLYRTKFDPILNFPDFQKWEGGSVPDEVKPFQKDVTWADGLLFVFPTWWNDRPAYLQGYFDRVYTKGFAWDFDENGLVGKLKGKRAFLSVTQGSPKELYQGLDIDMAHLHSSTQKGTLNFCGVADVKLVTTYGILMGQPGVPEQHVKDSTEAAVAFFK